MNVLRKSLVVQTLVFVLFFFMGVYIIAEYYLQDQFDWIGFVLLGLFVIFGVIGFLLYRKKDNRISVITEKELKTIKYLVYGYFGIYILEILLSGVENLNKELLAILTGVLLMVIAATGFIIQYRILKIKK